MAFLPQINITTNPLEFVWKLCSGSRSQQTSNPNMVKVLKVANKHQHLFRSCEAIGKSNSYVTLPQQKSCCKLLKDAELNFKTGLEPEEYRTIKTYVNSNFQKWEKELFATQMESVTLRIEERDSNLPRTLHIIKEKDKLYVMVLCEEKGIDEVGQGSQKKVTHAFDMLTGQRWAYNACSSPETIQLEIDIYKYLSDPEKYFPEPKGKVLKEIQKQVLLSPIGIHEYQKNGSREAGFFTPLLQGSLLDILCKYKLNERQKLEIAGDLLKGLYFLEQMQIEHGDIKHQNILCKFEGNRIRAYIMDFGVCRCEHPAMSKYKNIHVLAGNKYWQPPEKRRYIYAGDYPAYHQLIFDLHPKSWPKHDVWSMGEVFRFLFRNSPETEKYKEIDSMEGAYDVVIKAWRRDPEFAGKDFFALVYGNAQAPGKEPQRHSIFYIIWRMLHFKPEQRASATELLSEFQQFLIMQSIHKNAQKKSLVQKVTSLFALR